MSSAEGSLRRFRVAGYLKDRLPAIIASILFIALITYVLYAVGVSVWGAVFLVSVYAICMVIIAVVDIRKRTAFYNDAIATVETLPKAVHFASLVSEPGFQEGEMAYQLASSVARKAALEIDALNADLANYRDYIELWIHETKTPLAAAKLTLSEMHGRDADDLVFELERIETQIEQALYYARSTSVSNDYAIKEIRLADLVRSACRRNSYFLIRQGTTPQIDIPEDALVLADELWMMFVLSQVIVNAAKYDSTKISFTSSVEDEGTPREHTLLQVKDDGCGIDASDVPRVFERGFTGVNGRNSTTATGMGLYLAAIMCERMGVGIGIASEAGCGTRVLFTFPHDRRRQKLAAD